MYCRGGLVAYNTQRSDCAEPSTSPTRGELKHNSLPTRNVSALAEDATVQSRADAPMNPRNRIIRIQASILLSVAADAAGRRS